MALSTHWLSPGLPLIIASILVLVGGVWLLERAESQTRDTTRKHHIEDLEQALYFARAQQGTYPPYELESWCGTLNDPSNRAVRDQVEEALRTQHEKYANPAKPLPADPLFGDTTEDYFYWKRNPATFELYAVLEVDDNNERSNRLCDTRSDAITFYDYGILSTWREPQGRILNEI